jgi:hypothetical protein
LLAVILAGCALLSALSASAQGQSELGIARSPVLLTKPSYPVTLSQLEGIFYPNPRNSGTFDSRQLESPAFSQQFPVINFDPPVRAQGGCASTSHLGEFTRPYTDLITTATGQCGTEVAGAGGSRAGRGRLTHFEAVYLASLNIAEAGEVTFKFRADDGWILAIGPDRYQHQPRYVSGSLLDPPPAGPSSGYPVMGAHNTQGRPSVHKVTVSFPSGGDYPVEIDYTECCQGQDVMVLGTTFAIPAPQPATPPTVSNVTPAEGPRAGGTRLTIYGTGFSTVPGQTSFQFGPTGKLAAEVACASTTECRTASPSGGGTVDVIAVVGGQRSPVHTGDEFTFTVAHSAPVYDWLEIQPPFEPAADSKLRLHTSTPRLFVDLPIGAELVPQLKVEVRLLPGERLPTAFTDLEDANFTDIGSGAFSATCVCGFRAERQFLRAPTEIKIGISEFPTEDGSGKESAFALQVGEVAVHGEPVIRQTSLVTPEARITVDFALSVQLYKEQAVAYAVKKISEYVFGGASDILSGGGATPLVIAALALDSRLEIAWRSAQLANLISAARAAWQLGVHPPSIAELTHRLVHDVAEKLLGKIETGVKEKLRAAQMWILTHLREHIQQVLSLGRWFVTLGGRTIKSADAIVTHGRHFTNLADGALGPVPSADRFDALEPQPLPVAAVPTQEGLGFGPRVLSAPVALAAARALVQYDLPSATVRPLLVSSFTPEANHVLCVVGDHLNRSGRENTIETAEIDLTGPGYRGSQLIRTRFGIGGGCVTLPAQMRPGKWVIGVVAYSGHNSPSGVAVGAFPFTVTTAIPVPGGPGGKQSGVGAPVWVLIGLGIAAVLLLVPLVALGSTPVRGVAAGLLAIVIGGMLIDLSVELQAHTAQAIVLAVAGGLVLLAGVATLLRRAPSLGYLTAPAVGSHARSGRDRLRALMVGNSSTGWSTTNLVVVSLGVALAVFFAGVTAAVAAGQTPPTAMWAAGSAVAGGLIGLLVPPPGSKAAHLSAAEAATEAAVHAEATLRETHAEDAAGGGPPAARAATAEAVEATVQKSRADAAAHTAAAASIPETKGAAFLLLGVFIMTLALSIALAAGAIVPPMAFTDLLKSVTTAVIALASASGSALIGLLAPSPSKA